MKTTTTFAFSAACLTLAICFASIFISTTHADPFGSGVNAFDIEFVPISNLGNADDTTGLPNPAGKVDYFYRMGTYEISRDMITKANAEGGLGITLFDMSSFGGNGADKPATVVSWFEAAQFVNWLNTSTGNTPAYKFNGSAFELWQPADAGYNSNNLYRNSEAYYFLPSMDEWYKAAYYDADTASYGDYPTANGLVPTAVASGTAANTAVFGGQSGPADITQAGGLSPYGTMGQGGNVYEWVETDFDLLNDSSSSARGVRGGSWGFNSSHLAAASSRLSSNPAGGFISLGFRVASIPEPSTLLLGAMASVGVLMRRRGLM